MRRALIALIVSILPLVVSARVGQRASQRTTHAAGQSHWFFVAVLRSDGVVIPFATYWRGVWLEPWRQPKGYPPEVNSISDLPSPWFTKYEDSTPTWYARETRTRRALTLHASRLVEVDNHCAKNWGWQTDYSEAQKTEGHHLNVGIALSESTEIVTPSELDPRSEELKTAVSLIRSRFEEDERSWLARPDMAWRAKYVPDAKERAKRAPSVVSLNRIEARGGRTLYFFEAERRYPKPRGADDAECESLSAFSGILLQDGRGLWLVEHQFALSDCDGKEVTDSVPLGVIRDGGREFPILQEHGYEDESYTITELLRNGLLRRVRRVEGGGC